MKKKPVKKLQLHRETVLHLEKKAELQEVAGAATLALCTQGTRPCSLCMTC